jgi:hypothetical protein
MGSPCNGRCASSSWCARFVRTAASRRGSAISAAPASSQRAAARSRSHAPPMPTFTTPLVCPPALHHQASSGPEQWKAHRRDARPAGPGGPAKRRSDRSRRPDLPHRPPTRRDPAAGPSVRFPVVASSGASSSWVFSGWDWKGVAKPSFDSRTHDRGSDPRKQRPGLRNRRLPRARATTHRARRKGRRDPGAQFRGVSGRATPAGASRRRHSRLPGNLRCRRRA